MIRRFLFTAGAGSSPASALKTPSIKAEELNWTEEADARLVTIKLRGEINLQHSPELRELLQQKVRSKAPVLLLDFRDVKCIDFSGLATLLEYYKKSRSYAGRLALAGLSGRVHCNFELARLGEVMGVFPTVCEARKALLRDTGKEATN